MKDPFPLVSIITTTYNHERFIGPCIESALAQTYPHWEQIIVNDGSSDRTWEIVQSYAASDERIRPFTQENKGPALLSETCNFALHHARGEYIAFLEGDDRYVPEKLALQVPLHMENPNMVLSYGAYWDEFDGVLKGGLRPSFHGLLSIEDFLPKVLLHQSYMTTFTMLVGRQAMKEIGGFHQDGSPAAWDLATLLRLIQLSGDVYYLHEPLGIWRHHVGQATNVRAVDLAKYNMHLALKCYDELPKTIKQRLEVQREEIVIARHAMISATYFGLLRNFLHQRRREGIEDLILGTWRYGGLKRKTQAAYALVASTLGFDFEPVLKFWKK